MKDKVHYNTIMRLDYLDLHRTSLVKVAAFLDALSLKYFLKTFLCPMKTISWKLKN